MLLDPGQELAECEACERPVDFDGMALGHVGPNGVSTFKVIQLVDTDDDELDGPPVEMRTKNDALSA